MEQIRTIIASVLMCMSFDASTASAQVSDSLRECMCIQKNREISSHPRLLGMCMGHYDGDYYQQRCGTYASCLGEAMNNGLGGKVDTSKCLSR